VIEQLLTESVILAAMGGALGVAVAHGGMKFLQSYVSADVTPGIETLGLNVPVLLYALALACLTGLLFGLFPALVVSRWDLNAGLRQGSRGTTGRVDGLRGFLVAAEFAFSIVLAIAAVLMIRSFAATTQVQLGFDAENVLTMRIPLRNLRYTPSERARFYAQLVPRVEAIPGVKSASVSRGLPIAGWAGMDFVTDENPAPRAGDEVSANYVVISPHYFDVLRIPLLRGRTFADRDSQAVLPVVIVNEELARESWRNSNAIGKRIKMGTAKSPGPWLTVVGVARNVLTQGPESFAQPEIYVPYTQYPWVLGPRHLLVRMAQSVGTSTVMAAIRKEVGSLDADQPIAEVMPLDEIVRQPLAIRQFLMYLLIAFGALALILASLGVYGVLSYSVAQRTQEIGIRMALGAGRGDVVGQVVRRGMVMALAGVCAGVACALGLTRFLESLLYRVQPRDPVTFLLTPVMLLAIAAAAIYIPARRATQVDPIVALRFE
jgi:putative ABC transport system permease protein